MKAVPTPTTVDAYIAAFPRPVRPVLENVRCSIRKALPEAEESISYGIPTYKRNGRPIIYFAGLKHHYSIYPASVRLVAAFKQDLTLYEYNGKGTIRFPLDAAVPSQLITRIAKFLEKEVAARQERKTAANKG
jgi:uncharacterized protein YdhG (YjbR/CyaY superfamily)